MAQHTHRVDCDDRKPGVYTLFNNLSHLYLDDEHAAIAIEFFFLHEEHEWILWRIYDLHRP